MSGLAEPDVTRGTGASGGPGGRGLVLAVALAGLALGAAAGWSLSGAPSEPASLEDEMAAALRRVDPVVRRRELLEVAAKMGPETVDALRAGFEREIRFADRCLTQLFAASWAAFDAPAAFAATEAWDSPLRRSHATSEIAYGLARDGRVDEARSLAESLSLSRVRTPTLAGLAEGVIRSGDLEGAMAFLDRPDSTDRNRLIESFLRGFLVRGDLEGAMAWAEEIPADAPHALKRSVFALTARWLSGVDPRRAADWYEAQPEDASWTRLGHLAIAEEWIEHEPEAALDWLLARTRPGERRDDLRRVLRRFIERDPDEAAAWMERQDPLGEAVVVVPELVSALETERPADALAWARRIEDARIRDGWLVLVAGRWLEREPAAARAWLAENALPEEIRRRIEAEHPGAAEGTSS